jgi:hypothetical protein
MQHPIGRAFAGTFVALGLALSLGVAAAGPAAAAVHGDCQGPVRDLRAAFASLNPTGTTAPAGSADAQNLQQRGTELFGTALTARPDCANDFKTLAAALAAAARSKALIKGTPFLGPIGWLWNNVYYRVFNGNDVMMGMFGWALLLSPFILVVAVSWVMRGASRGLRKPYVPEHLRFDA